VKPLDRVTVPSEVVTTTSCGPAVPAGVTIVSAVAVLVSLVASTPPTVTEVAFDKFVPEITVLVPPANNPEVTESDVTVGVEAWAGRVESDEKLVIKNSNTVGLTNLRKVRGSTTLIRIKSSLKEIFSRPVLPEDSYTWMSVNRGFSFAHVCQLIPFTNELGAAIDSGDAC
jgi:hypothetical protein